MNPILLQEVARGGGDFQTVFIPAAVNLARRDSGEVLRSLRLPDGLPGLQEDVDHVGVVVNPWDARAVVDEARLQGVITTSSESVVLSREIGPGHIVRIGHSPALEFFVPDSVVAEDEMLALHVAFRLESLDDLNASVEMLLFGVGAYGSSMCVAPFMEGPEEVGDCWMVYLEHPSGSRLELLAPV